MPNITNVVNNILSSNFYPSINIVQDGKIHRFGKDKKYWYICHDNWILVDDWSGELPRINKPLNKEDYINFTKREQQLIHFNISQTIKKERENKKKLQEVAACKSQWLWNTKLSSHGFSKYLNNKGLKPIDGIKFGNNDLGNFIATALRDNQGNIHAIQSIYDDIGKKFIKNGNPVGHYCSFGNKKADIIYICEGVATALTILLATPNNMVVVAYCSHNIIHVVNNIIKCYPDKFIIIAGDNDEAKQLNYNAGLESAIKVSKQHKVTYVVPSFQDISSKPTDFDDLRQLEGIESVRSQLGGYQYAN